MLFPSMNETSYVQHKCYNWEGNDEIVSQLEVEPQLSYKENSIACTSVPTLGMVGWW